MQDADVNSSDTHHRTDPKQAIVKDIPALQVLDFPISVSLSVRGGEGWREWGGAQGGDNDNRNNNNNFFRKQVLFLLLLVCGRYPSIDSRTVMYVKKTIHVMIDMIGTSGLYTLLV